MTDLIERYVHQVGHYLPPRERAEVVAELRSQIQDQLDDRYGAEATDEEIATILTELGNPYQIATSYGSEQYLVGPGLYPVMMMVLRHIWLIVPSIVIFLNVFGALISSQDTALLGLLIDTVIGVVQATLIFSGLAVLVFATIQHANFEFDEEQIAFNPLDMPEVNDPRVVDRFESTFGIVFGSIITLIFVYFLRVGGLTLRFNLNDTGEVITVPTFWLVLFILLAFAMVILHVVVLRRNRWTVSIWLTETVLEAIGAICLYFVLYQPLLEPILTAVPALRDVPFIENAPEIFAIVTATSTLAGRGSKLIKLWSYTNNNTLPFSNTTNE